MNEILFLIVYSILKAFLPLPSLEVVLIPLVIRNPDGFLLYSLLGAIGTFIGGSIGYFLATRIKEDTWIVFFGKATWEKGKQLFHRYGALAVFIGGVTPIPDFILAYIAGFTRMNYFLFASSDGIARLLRSIIVLYFFIQLGVVIDMDKYGTIMLIIVLAYFFVKYIVGMMRNRVK
ncbi:MAG: VTT domain-containing protein [Bacilli bacterium]|nr:VTT domain-containing protein [Bacilli bacterium]